MPLLDMRNLTMLKQGSVNGPHFLVSLGTVPGFRAQMSVPQTIQSLLKQWYPPRAVVVVAPRSFRRFPGQHVDLEGVRQASKKDPRVMTRYCDQDYGPGTKLICALPVLRILAASAPEVWSLIVADDDKVYKPWVLQGLQSAMQTLPQHQHAFSYMTWDIWMSRDGSYFHSSARAQMPANSLPHLRLGQGADLIAMPATALLQPANFVSDDLRHVGLGASVSSSIGRSGEGGGGSSTVPAHSLSAQRKSSL